MLKQKTLWAVMYAPGSGDINIHNVLGDFGYENQSVNTFGLSYTHTIKKFLSFETGINYLTANVKETSFFTGTRYDQIKMITIPVLAKLSFLKYLYADFGLLLDFQTNYNSNSLAPDQSGIGLEGGVGAKYNFGKLMLFVDPYLQYHGLTQFNKGRGFELLNTGVKLGLGYNF
jgi:hypothetical protein